MNPESGAAIVQMIMQWGLTFFLVGWFIGVVYRVARMG